MRWFGLGGVSKWRKQKGLGSTGQPGLEPQKNSQDNTEASAHESCFPEQTNLLVYVSKLSRERKSTFLTFLAFDEGQGQFAL